MPIERCARHAVLFVALVLTFGAALCAAEPELTELPPPKEREQVGEVLGKPVYRDEIDVKDSDRDPERSLQQELVRLFVDRPIQRYIEKHKSEIEPTAGELKAAAIHFAQRRNEDSVRFRRQLKTIQAQLAESIPPDDAQKLEKNREALKQVVAALDDAEFGEDQLRYFIVPLKLHRHLHQRFGGRVFAEKFGTIAYDAERKAIEELEKNGAFKINDPALRLALHAQLIDEQDKELLVENKDEIRQLFYPAWLPAEPTKTAATASTVK